MFGIQLAVGFGTSVVLLAVTFTLTRSLSDTVEAGVDATSVPIMRMAYRHPQLQNIFLQVVKPTTGNLPTMGTVKMHLAHEKPPSTSQSIMEDTNLCQPLDDKPDSVPILYAFLSCRFCLCS